MIYLNFPSVSSDNESSGCGVDTLGIMMGEVETIDAGSVMKITTTILDGVIPNILGICELEVQ